MNIFSEIQKQNHYVEFDRYKHYCEANYLKPHLSKNLHDYLNNPYIVVCQNCDIPTLEKNMRRSNNYHDSDVCVGCKTDE